MSAIHALSQLSYSPDDRCAPQPARASWRTKGTRHGAVSASYLRDPQHHRRIAPEALEPIQLPLLGHERVHYNVAEIDQHPTTGVVTLDTDRSPAGLDRLLANCIRDRLHLPLAPTGADDEQVRDRRELRDIQHEDVL